MSPIISRIQKEVEKVIVGQGEAIDQLTICLLSRGHALLEGVPGTAKTLLAKVLAASLDLSFGRIQFTPDLMPADIIGTNIFDPKTTEFRMIKGPVFTEILLGDELNRTPPKTQAALLEAMEERQITIDGHPHPLPHNFFVIATQNPLEMEGTFPLPESQIDRFMMKIIIDYPNPEEEVEVLRRHQQGMDPHDLEASGISPQCSSEELENLRQQGRKTTVSNEIMEYVVQIVSRTRHSPALTWGSSPRSSVLLMTAARSLAAIRGREFVTPDDVKEVAPPVLRHRLALKPEAEIEGLTPDQVIQQILSEVEVPR